MIDADDTISRRPASPTMTMHTKAATEEIYEMFNQPLQNSDESDSSSDKFGDNDDDEDDDYTNNDEDGDDDDFEDEHHSFGTLNSQAHDMHINSEFVENTRAKGNARYAPTFPPMTPIAEATETTGSVRSAIRRANNTFMSNYPGTNITIPIPDAICDPTSLAHKEAIMRSSSITKNENFHYNMNKSFRKKDMLRKTFSSRRKSDINSRSQPTLRFPESDEMYCIRRLLGEGGFGCVYLAESETGEIRAIKVDNDPNPWECYVLNLVYQKFVELRHERELELVIQASSMYLFQDESYLILEYLDQGTVLDAVNISREQTGNGLEECLVIYLTIELLRVVEALHDAQIIHGDLKPDNVMLSFQPVRESDWDRFYRRDGSDGWSSKGIKIIDFGRAIDMNAYRPDVQFTVDWKMDEQDCIEMRENRPWTYQADYHGVAGVIHCLLFGKFIQITELHKSKTGGRREFGLSSSYKRYWQQQLWSELFHTLLNSSSIAAESGQQLPITSTIRDQRVKLERWLEENCESGSNSLKTAIKKIESALQEKRRRR